MNRLVFVFLVGSAIGCASRESTPSCDDGLCASGFNVTIADENGGAIAPGQYSFDLRFDTLRTSEDCIVAAPPATPQCNGGLVTLVQKDLTTVGFEVKGPPAARAEITVRAPCVAAPLAAKTFEPAYSCATGCRKAAATLTLPSAGLTICDDAGTD